jgi:hypothetical protein
LVFRWLAGTSVTNSSFQEYTKTWEGEMFQASLGGGFGAQEYGLRASIKAAVAYDELCAKFLIEITFQPQAIVIEGRIPPEVVRRVRAIIVEVAGTVTVWDRTFWLD